MPLLQTVQQKTKNLDNEIHFSLDHSKAIEYVHIAAQQLLLEVLHALGVEPVPTFAALQHIVIEFSRFAAVAVDLLFVDPMLLIPAELIRLWVKPD